MKFSPYLCLPVISEVDVKFSNDGDTQSYWISGLSILGRLERANLSYWIEVIAFSAF
jgi:hypothetical protein